LVSYSYHSIPIENFDPKIYRFTTTLRKISHRLHHILFSNLTTGDIVRDCAYCGLFFLLQGN